MSNLFIANEDRIKKAKPATFAAGLCFIFQTELLGAARAARVAARTIAATAIG